MKETLKNLKRFTLTIVGYNVPTCPKNSNQCITVSAPKMAKTLKV